MAKKDYRAQLAEAKEENYQLRSAMIQQQAMLDERINQARKDERAKIAGEILAGRGGE